MEKWKLSQTSQTWRHIFHYLNTTQHVVHTGTQSMNQSLRSNRVTIPDPERFDGVSRPRKTDVHLWLRGLERYFKEFLRV